MNRRTFLTYPIVSAALPSMAAASAVLSRIPHRQKPRLLASPNISFTANLPLSRYPPRKVDLWLALLHG